MLPAKTASDAPQTTLGAAATAQVDVLVVGGGINGAGIARDLAGRGLSVLLCEKDDLGSHTSSASTKLIHGGLRYLEHYEFSMVRKALAEREVLLRCAPHIIRPMRFVLPHDPRMRPVWMVRAGLFLYDHLARRKVLGASQTVDLRRHELGKPLKRSFSKGFVYSDGWVDDARLVVLNAMDAAARGARVLTRWACVAARRGDRGWQAQLQSAGGETLQVHARALVNAAGPWAAQFLAERAHALETKPLRLVKGSHIVVNRLFDHDHAYLFQNPDKRIIFVIPYEQDFTLIGTTDVEFSGDIGAARVEPAEVSYLCQQASRYLELPVLPEQVVWAFSGVRPLIDDESGDPSQVTRDYVLELDRGRHGASAPLLSVWGGKLTTYRKLAEEAGKLLAAPLGAPRGAWTHDSLLPGGDLRAWIGPAQRPDTDFARFEQALALRFAQLPPALCHRLARAYGALVERWLLPDQLGAEVAPGLFEAELHYLHQHEWARTAEDVLWRRSKLGLHFSVGERDRVATWCANHWPEGGSPLPAGPVPAMESAWN